MPDKRRVTDQPSTPFSWVVHETPIGPLLLAATSVGLVNVVFHAQRKRVQQSVTLLGARLAAEPDLASREGVSAVEPGAGWAAPPEADDVISSATQQLDAYFAGDLRAFTLPLDWSLASSFHSRVLRTLAATVAYGKVVSYQDLADRVKEPGAARAVGTAMGANPLPVVVPCHRVVASGGGIGGFGGGLDTKRALLALEGVLPQPLFS